MEAPVLPGHARASPSMASLPAEVVAHIIAPLGVEGWARIAATCRSFRAAATSLLGTVDFMDLKNGGALLDDACFVAVVKRLGPAVQRMELDCWHLGDHAGALLPPSVTELALCGADHHSNALLEGVAARLGPNLHRFAWSGFGGAVNESGFKGFAERCRGLTSFSLDSGEALNPNKVVRAVADNCPGLVELSAYDLEQETFLHLRRCGISLQRLRHKRRRPHALPLTDVTLLMLTGMCPLLEELALTDHTDGDEYGDVTDVGLLALTERAATLRVLKLKLHSAQAANRCSGVAVMELASACTKLTRLELCNFKRLTDPPFYEIVQRCSGLMDLSVDGAPITDASLEFLATNCARLRILSIKFCRKLTDGGIAALGQLQLLESVNAGQASGITDQSVAAICSGASASRLKSLVLNYGQLSDAALVAIAQCPLMQELALHSCPRITNKGLCALARGCPLLRFLSLSAGDLVSDAGILALAASCPRLQKIRLDSCRLLSNPCVRALCRPALRLRHLSMQHCPKLSDGLFAHLLGAPSLRFVDLGRAKLTRGAVEGYHRQRPFVEIYIDGETIASAFPSSFAEPTS